MQLISKHLIMNNFRIIVIGILTLLLTSCEQKISKTNSLSDTMDGILTRFYSEFTPEELNNVTPEFILTNIHPEERKAFASKRKRTLTTRPVRSIMF